MMEVKGNLALFLFQNLIAPVFLSADKSLLNLGEKYKSIQILRYMLGNCLILVLRLLPSLFPSINGYPVKPIKGETYPNNNKREEDSGIARALSQMLSLMNQIPVNSRKYETVRCLADKLIEDNLREGFETLRQVNRTVLAAAFSTTLSQLEAAMLEQERERLHGASGGSGLLDHRLTRVLRAVQSVGAGAGFRFGQSREEGSRSVESAEKSAAELLWLAQKLVACGCADEAVSRWGSASSLAWLAISAEPRLQGSLVKLSALLFKQVKEIGKEEEEECEEGKKKDEQKVKMLMSWLPLLCRANNGIDTPVLNGRVKMEVEREIEEIIEMLKEEEEKEKVLSLWLHHFTSSSSSDWPNLQTSYSRWCDASRKLMILP